MHLPEHTQIAGRELLRLARGSIEHGLSHGEPLPVRDEDLTPALARPGATFTTLHAHGELRGCCGSLAATRPLGRDVARSAFQAAFRDPRFRPVVAAEFDAITLEVSVLSAPRPMPVADEEDLLAQLVPGTDGLVIMADGLRATFLPKVWDALPDPRDFLAALKAKCGLPPDYWSERLAFERYRTASYSEVASAA